MPDFKSTAVDGPQLALPIAGRKPPRLSDAQRRMLRAIRDHGNPTHGLRGRSAHGGADGTLASLVKRKLVARVSLHENSTNAGGWCLTPLGTEAL